jgi:hypothetical protein
VLISMAVGCEDKCTFDQPCATPDGGTLFTCGNTQCTGDQLCVVPTTCGADQSATAAGARCVARPADCTDARTECACEAGHRADGGELDSQCCYASGHQPFTFNICTFGCL